jgi:hypothetical protein
MQSYQLDLRTFVSSKKRTRDEYVSTNSKKVIVPIIYKWTFTPPFEHVLANCSYIGQTHQTLKNRTMQHKNDSKRNNTELGLHALWKQYPYDDHWDISVIEEKEFTNIQDACKWMNEREIELIDEYGGILKDMDRKVKQTLNLTRGGQGDPRKKYESILARSRKRLNKIWPAFEQFYEKNKHLRIPQDHVEIVDGRKENLGITVSNIRNRSDFLHYEKFKLWLDTHGFVYDEHRAHLELDVWPAFEQFYEREKHLRIPQDHVEIVDGRDVTLGITVNSIRSRGFFLHHEKFKLWLDTHGFVYDENRAHLELDVWPALEQFYEREKHLRIPQDHVEIVDGRKVTLGQTVVSSIRNKGCFLHHEKFKSWLDTHGFVYDENRAHFELDVWPALKQFYEKNKHLRIPQDHVEIVDGRKENLGFMVSNIRNRSDFLQYEKFKLWLDTHGFVYDEHRAHLELDVWPAFKQFYEKNKHLRIPRKHAEIVDGREVKLGRTVSNIRCQNYFLQHKDFAMWLWCGCFKMHTKCGEENEKRWKRVFA